MAEPLVIALGARFDDDVVAEIRAADSRIEIVYLPPMLARDPSTVGDAEKAEAKEALARAEILFGPGQLGPEFFEGATRLKWFQVMTAGVDRLMAEGLLGKGFEVTTVRGMTAPAIAEWVMGAMIMVEKRFHHAVRQQLRHEWKFTFTGELRGRTLGIVGMGAIGRETARRARVFGMKVLATRRTVGNGEDDEDCDEMLPYTELGSVLERSDYVAICVPLTAETRHFIGAAELARMKPTAHLINIARGPVVDQEALVAALKDGVIAGAALDVTDPEPLPPDSPLWDMENVILTPHISGAIEGYGHRAAAVFLENLGRYLRGEPLLNRVSAELGY